MADAELTPEAQQLSESQALDASMPVEAWLALFQSLEAHQPGFFKRVFTRKKKLPPAAQGFIVPLLALLREDLQRNTPISLRIDFREAPGQEHKVEPPPPGYRSMEETLRAQNWFAGGTELVDGARVQWSITDHVRERKGWKRSASGKLKRKSKSKKKAHIDVWLAVPAQLYRVAERPTPPDVKKVKVKEGDKRDKLHVRRVVKSADAKAALDLNDFALALGEAYARARPTWRGAA